MLRWKFHWTKLHIHFVEPRSKVHHPKAKSRVQHAMHLLIPYPFENSVFVPNFAVFFISSRAEHFQTWLQNSVSSHKCQQAAAWSRVTFSGDEGMRSKTHRGVERSCQWDVHLWRLRRHRPPGPRCCGGAKSGESLNPKTAGAALRLEESPVFL